MYIRHLTCHPTQLYALHCTCGFFLYTIVKPHSVLIRRHFLGQEVGFIGLEGWRRHMEEDMSDYETVGASHNDRIPIRKALYNWNQLNMTWKWIIYSRKAVKTEVMTKALVTASMERLPWFVVLVFIWTDTCEEIKTLRAHFYDKAGWKCKSLNWMLHQNCRFYKQLLSKLNI